jgi:outer membrane biosynthesis protein TonB
MEVSSDTKIISALISIFIIVCLIYIAMVAFKKGKLRVGISDGRNTVMISQPVAPQPQPVYQPQPVVQQPVYQPAPQPVYQPVAPAPVPQPQPVYQEPQPQPVVQQPVITPVYEQEPQKFMGAVLSDVNSDDFD